MGERRLIGGGVVARHRRLKAWKAGDHVAGAVVAFQLDVTAAAGRKTPPCAAMAGPASLA